jgi:hypothetical protein
MDARRPMPLASPLGTLAHLSPIVKTHFHPVDTSSYPQLAVKRRPAMPDPPRTLAA